MQEIAGKEIKITKDALQGVKIYMDMLMEDAIMKTLQSHSAHSHPSGPNSNEPCVIEEEDFQRIVTAFLLDWS